MVRRSLDPDRLAARSPAAAAATALPLARIDLRAALARLALPLAVAALAGRRRRARRGFGPDGLVYGLARLAVTGALLAGAIVVWWRREEASVVGALGLLPIVGAAGVWARRPADLQRAQPSASGSVPGHPRRGGGDGVACAPRPRRGGPGHRRRAVRCRLVAADAGARRLRLGRAHPHRPRLECPRAAHRRLPHRRRQPARGRDPDHLGGVLVPPRPAGARVGAGPPQLPRPLRDRAVSRSRVMARALPRPRERDPPVHVLRPSDPRPPARTGRARPLPGADPRPRCLLLRAGRGREGRPVVPRAAVEELAELREREVGERAEQAHAPLRARE